MLPVLAWPIPITDDRGTRRTLVTPPRTWPAGSGHLIRRLEYWMPLDAAWAAELDVARKAAQNYGALVGLCLVVTSGLVHWVILPGTSVWLSLGAGSVAAGVLMWPAYPPIAWLQRRACAGALRNGYRRAGRCAACGYNFASLPAGPDDCTVCPECGAAWMR